MIEYRTRFKRHLELWFEAPEPPGDFDIIVRLRSPRPAKRGVTSNFYTLQLDLTKSCDDLFSGFDRNTRAQIKKAITLDQLNIEFLDSPSLSELNAFIEFYDEFARTKRMAPLHRARMDGLHRSGCLSLTRVIHEGKTVMWHANVRYKTHVSMMYSASHYRTEDSADVRRMIGRANRRLHWEELQHYKALGCKVYDFGGWYEGTTDKPLLLINQFKEGFGGTRVLLYRCEEHRTLLAKAMSVAHRVRGITIGRMVPLMLILLESTILPLGHH